MQETISTVSFPGPDLSHERSPMRLSLSHLPTRLGTATTMLWWSMLEVALASIAACLPSQSVKRHQGVSADGSEPQFPLKE